MYRKGDHLLLYSFCGLFYPSSLSFAGGSIKERYQFLRIPICVKVGVSDEKGRQGFTYP